MSETQKAAIILHGYWTGVILCGRELPSQYLPAMNIADAVNAGQIPECDYGHAAVRAMVALVEKLEVDAHAVWERRQIVGMN